VAAFTGLVELSSQAVGGEALSCSDDWFASMTHLLKPGRAVFDPDAYTDTGKVMDGWESRRRRTPGHDWVIVKLGVPGRIRGVDIDTDHFLGNHAPFASVEACAAAPDATAEDLRDRHDWITVVAEVELQRGSRNLAAATGEGVFTHVRLNIYPDGGVARLRVYGDPEPAAGGGELDLASVLAGGRAVVCSDRFFSPPDNLVAPGRSAFMGGGWETRRSRPPGSDWIVVELGAPGLLRRLVLETHHFKGNYPDRAAIDGLYWPDAPPSVLGDHPDWTEIVGETKLRADTEHELAPSDPGPFTHLRLRIVPDGGVSRLRAFGTVATGTPAQGDPLLEHINGLDESGLTEALLTCCGAWRWARAMVQGRPYTSRTHLHGHSERVWWHLGDRDWLQAFGHHPAIGEDVASLREKFAGTAALSEAEQAGVRGADEATLQALAEGNAAYHERFGYLFIVCATGLTAKQMLAMLHERLPNEPAAELRIAAGEQAKITAIRLEQLEPG
jgi:allantoicase